MATICFVGNLGNEPEKKSETAPVRLSVADKDAREGDSPWYEVAVWGKQGEACLAHLHKGSQVFVSGDLALHQYDGKTYPRVEARRVTFLGSKPKGDAPAKAEPAAGEERPFG